MADIFLSYARADQAKVAKLAAALEDAGYSVWWDRHIDGGAEFTADIENALANARLVIVAWSKDAVASRWVRDEAGVALEQEKLVAICLDGTPPPLGFKQIHAVDMHDSGGHDALLRSIAHRLGGEEPAQVYRPHKRIKPVHIIFAALIALMIAVAAWFGLRGDHSGTSDADGDDVVLAIMPLSTSQEETGFIASGLPISLGNGLVAHAELQLISPSSTRAVASEGLTAPEIGERLGASHLVEGDVVQANDQTLTIDLRLVEASSARLLWSRQYRFANEDLARQQNIMGRDVTIALASRLGLSEASFDQLPEIDPRAYAAYLRGLENMIGRDRPGARLEAVEQFGIATSIEPDLAPAYAGAAFIYMASSNEHFGIRYEQRVARYRQAITKALELDPDDPFARATSLAGALNAEGRLAGLSEQAGQLVRDAPNYHLSHYVYALLLEVEGKVAQSARHYEQAVALNPADQTVRYWRAKVNMQDGNYDAIRSFALDCNAECSRPDGLWYMALASFGTPRQIEQDWPALKTRFEARFDSASATALERALLAISDPEKSPISEQELARVVEIFNQDGDDLFAPVAIISRLGKFEAALAAWEIAWEGFPLDMPLILNSGRMSFTEAQRADPRYHSLFEQPLAKEIAEHRRENGITAGLPVFPVKPYEGD